MERSWRLPVWVLVLLLGGAAPLPVRVPAPADRHAAADTSDRLFLWRVTPKAGRNVVYLLGSIHAAAKDFYPLPDEIEDAFAQSKVLAVEVDLAAQDQDALQQLLLDKGTYRDNDSLARHVPQATYERVGKYGAALGLPAMVTDGLRPWALNVLITLLEAQKAGLKQLVDDRNVMMAKKIEGYVRSRRPHFVIVGAGHLSGPNSIPRLLEKRGCKVEQVRRKAAGDEPEPADAPPADAQPKSKATRPLVPSAR